ncbi:MAG: NBR1-Ig-like domain-containing protein [Chloroflexota bacterium]
MIKRRFRDISLLLGLLILVTGCFGGSSEPEEPATPEPVTPRPSATPIPTVTPFPTNTTVPTNTPLPTASATPDVTATYIASNTIDLDQEVTYQGITLKYSEKLFNSLEAKSNPAIRNISNPANVDSTLLDGVPDVVLFEGSVEEPTSRQPLLIVQPIIDTNGFYFQAYDADEKLLFDTLRRNVNTRPNPSILFSPTDYVIQSTYVDFQGGSGISNVRFLTSTDNPEEFTNQQLFYVFEGVSDDGRYYVYFQYPVSVDVLPNEPTFSEAQLDILAENEDNYIIYLMNEMDQVGKVSTADLNPGREILDSLISTLQFDLNIGPDAVVAVGDTNPADENTQSENETEVELSSTPQEIAEVGADEVATQDPPTAEPTSTSTSEPTATPEPTETEQPTDQPSNTPTTEPTNTPTLEPTDQPTATSTALPTATDQPTATNTPTSAPTETPQPTDQPTNTPTATVEPSRTPTLEPTATEAATATPEPTATIRPSSAGPVPTYDPNCSNYMVYRADVTIPDGSIIEGGETFTKTWRVVNLGSCPITPLYDMISFSSNPIPVVSTEEVPIIEPDEEGELTVVFRAPTAPGQYISNWQLRAPDGFIFGQIYVIIEVP